MFAVALYARDYGREGVRADRGERVPFLPLDGTKIDAYTRGMKLCFVFVCAAFYSSLNTGAALRDIDVGRLVLLN